MDIGKSLAYPGAIIDGEGCIFMRQRNQNYQITLSVANTFFGLIEFLNKNFNGNISEFKAKGNRKKFWRWNLIGNQNIINFLEKIIPYLLIKREQAELALEFAKSRVGIFKDANQNLAIYSELRRLKKEYPTKLPNYNFSEEEKVDYLAGLIDGEGSIRITKAVHKNEYGNQKLILVPQITIGNTDKRLMDFLMKEFGGFFYEKKRDIPWKSLYQWFMQGNKKEFFLKLKGKLLEKEERLNLLLKYLESRENNYQHTEEEIEIFLKLRAVNGKGKTKYDKKQLLEYTKLIRSPRTFFASKEELEKLYINKKRSIRQIAKLYNMGFNTVRKRLIKYNIKLRDSKEGIKLNPSKLTEKGRKSISEASSKNRKKAWQDPTYRKKMLGNLAIARSKITNNK